MDGCTDGLYLLNKVRYFDCPPNKGYFCLLEQLVPDQRFMASSKDLNTCKLCINIILTVQYSMHVCDCVIY